MAAPEELKVSPQALKTSSTQIERKVSEISSALDIISLQMQKLPDSFKGTAASEFMDKYQALTKRYDAFEGAMLAYAKFLNKTSETYAETNTEIANLAQQYLDE